VSRIPVHAWFPFVGTIFVTTVTIPLTGAPSGQSENQSAGRQQFIVVAKDGASRADLRAHITSTGGTIVRELAQIGAFVVSGADLTRQRVAASPLASGVASDQIARLIQPANAHELLHQERQNPYLRVVPATST
jgi:hypothetical protein